jgi:TetR/AcrR family transcriptional regulator
MSRQERKEREKAARRRSILDTARALFVENGVESTTMQEIADAAELSKAAIYLYFKDKAELLDEVLFGAFSRFYGYLAERRSAVGSGLEKILVMGRAYGDYAREYPDDLRLAQSVDILTVPLVGHSPNPERFQAILSNFAEELADSFEAGVVDGSLRPELDCRKTAVLVVELVPAFLQRLAREEGTVKDNTGFDTGELTAHLFDLLVQSMRNSTHKDDK